MSRSVPPLLAPAYWAFISYSRHDAGFAAALHRAIETYGIPAPLLTRATPLGEVPPRRLKPLFLDRDELPAAPDLRAEIDEKLAASRYLIVICSPRAVLSPWVKHEVETFRALGREDRVFAVIVDGRPNCGGPEECLPEPLRHLPPALQVDGRAGLSEVRANLIAAMLGVDLSLLKARDSQRRSDRLRGVVVVACVATLLIALLARVAQVQRDNARVSRAEAEDLARHLLTEITWRLKPLGQRALLDRVHAEVARSIALPSELQPKIPRTRALLAATAFLGRGELADEDENYAAARGHFEEAEKYLHRVLVTSPANREARKAERVLHFDRGHLLLQEDHLAEAEAELRRALQLDGELTGEKAEDDVTWWHAEDNRLLGHIQQRRRRDNEARQSFGTAITLMESLAARHPNATVYAGKLAQYRAWRAEPLFHLGRYDDLLREGGDARQRLLELVTRFPRNTDWRETYAWSCWVLGGTRFERDQMTEALEDFTEQLATAEDLNRWTPTNVGWRFMVLNAQLNVAITLDRLKKTDAEEHWQKAKALALELQRAGHALNSYQQSALSHQAPASPAAPRP